jgi:hypothetical protein
VLDLLQRAGHCYLVVGFTILVLDLLLGVHYLVLGLVLSAGHWALWPDSGLGALTLGSVT